MKSHYDYLEAARFIGTKKETFDMALECGADSWEVIKVSPRQFALFCGQSVNLIPNYEPVVIGSDS